MLSWHPDIPFVRAESLLFGLEPTRLIVPLVQAAGAILAGVQHQKEHQDMQGKFIREILSSIVKATHFPHVQKSLKPETVVI